MLEFGQVDAFEKRLLFLRGKRAAVCSRRFFEFDGKHRVVSNIAVRHCIQHNSFENRKQRFRNSAKITSKVGTCRKNCCINMR